MTNLKLAWRSRHADAPRCMHFPTDICYVFQEGEITVEKCAHRGASARQERHMLSLGRNKHVHNYSAPKRFKFSTQSYAMLLYLVEGVDGDRWPHGGHHDAVGHGQVHHEHVRGCPMVDERES